MHYLSWLRISRQNLVPVKAIDVLEVDLVFDAAHREQVHRETENVVMRVHHVPMPQGWEAGQICAVSRRGFAVWVFPVASRYRELPMFVCPPTLHRTYSSPTSLLCPLFCIPAVQYEAASLLSLRSDQYCFLSLLKRSSLHFLPSESPLLPTQFRPRTGCNNVNLTARSSAGFPVTPFNNL